MLILNNSRNETYVTLENVTHQQVVVHGFCRDLRYRLGGHFNVRKVLGCTGL